MKIVTVTRPEATVEVTMLDEETSWKDIMYSFVDVLKGLGYVSEELDYIQEKIIMEE